MIGKIYNLSLQRLSQKRYFNVFLSCQHSKMVILTGHLFLAQVHLSIYCVLISPKRKLVGHLLIMQKVLHFTGHFLVEGTAGSSVLNKISDRNFSDPKNSDLLNGTDKQKQSKGIKSFESNYGKNNIFDVLETDDLLQNKTSKIKLHRRWNISKVNFETIFIFFLHSDLYYYSLYLFVSL